jgi:hypothetical protein
MTTAIYLLIDPIDNRIRYIGQTRQELYQRLSDHIKRSKKTKSLKDKWIQSLITKGERPIIYLYKAVEDFLAVTTEDETIRLFRSCGYDLFNVMKPIKANVPPGILQKLEYEDLLGIITDGEIARLFHLQPCSVWEARHARGIKAPIHPHQCKHNLSDYIHLLGKKLDSDIGKEFNVTKQNVGAHRRKLGIASFGNKCNAKKQYNLSTGS